MEAAVGLHAAACMSAKLAGTGVAQATKFSLCAQQQLTPQLQQLWIAMGMRCKLTTFTSRVLPCCHGLPAGDVLGPTELQAGSTSPSAMARLLQLADIFADGGVRELADRAAELQRLLQEDSSLADAICREVEAAAAGLRPVSAAADVTVMPPPSLGGGTDLCSSSSHLDAAGDGSPAAAADLLGLLQGLELREVSASATLVAVFINNPTALYWVATFIPV